MKTLSLGSELFNTDGQKEGQADMNKLVVVFIFVILRRRLKKSATQDERYINSCSCSLCMCSYCLTRKKKGSHCLVIFLLFQSAEVAQKLVHI